MVGKVELSGHLHNRFDHVRIPRENLLNSVADVTPDGQYESAIKDPDQVISYSNLSTQIPC